MRSLVLLPAVLYLFLGTKSFVTGAEHDWRLTPHHISLVLGGTDTEKHPSAFTIGVDYEYRLSDFTGVGAVAEYARGHLECWTYLLVADLHLTPAWIIQVGPGFEKKGTKEHTVLRLGTLYEFSVGAVTISPQLHYDYLPDYHDAVVAAVGFGVSF